MRLFVFIFLSILFLFTPFMKGLYFDQDFYSIQLIVVGCFFFVLLYLLLRREKLGITYPVVIVILPLLLFISYFYSVTPLGAMNQVLRWTTYGCFFLLVLYTVQEEKYKRYFYYLIHLTGFIISIFSLAGYYRLFEAEGFIVADRLGGVFQYPNTFAAIMGGLALFSISILTEHNQGKVERILLAIPIIPAILSVLLSDSRGVLIVLSLVWFIGLFLYKTKQQLNYIIVTILSAGFGVILFSLSENKSLLISIYLSLSILLFVFLELYLNHFINKYKQSTKFGKVTNLHPLVIPFFMIIVLGLAALDVLFKGLLYSYLPAGIKERILYINFETFSERITIAKDALMASVDSFIFGFGGESWSVLFTKYQSMPYQTNNLHNGYLEWLLNTGIIGFVFFAGIFIYFFINLFKHKEKILHSKGILLFLLLVFLHSIIDFNMSYGTVWFFIFVLFAIGLSNQDTKGNIKSLKSFRIYALMIFIFLGGFTLFHTGRLMMSNHYFNQAVEESDLQYKIYYVNKSIEYNSHDIDKWNTLGLLLLEDKSKNKQVIKRIAEKMIEEEPNQSKGYTYAVHLLERAGLLREANKMVDEALEIDHFNTSLHEDSMRLKMNIALSYNQMKDTDTAQRFADKAIKQYQELEMSEKKLLKILPGENFNSRKFSITDEIDYYYAVLLFIREDYKNAVKVADKLLETENYELNIRAKALSYVVKEIESGQKIDLSETNNEKLNQYIVEFKQIYHNQN